MKLGKWMVSFCIYTALVLVIHPAVSAQGAQQDITKSVSATSQIFHTSSGKRTVQIVKINLNDTRLEVRPVLAFSELGKTQSLEAMAKQYKALAAINGSFFMAYNKEEPKPPWGMIVIDYNKKNEGSSGSSIGFNGNAHPVISPSTMIDSRAFEHITSAGPTLVREGKIVVDPLAEGMTDPKLTTLSGQRSFIGYTADNQLVMGTVPNVTLNQLALICQSLGLQAAMNLDGGAASGLYANGKMVTAPGRNLSNALVVTSRQTPPIQVKWHSVPLLLSQEPALINGSVYVVADEFFTKLGASVTVDQQEKMRTITKAGREIRLWESGRATVDGENLQSAGQTRMIMGKLMIPIRFAADLLDARVEWDAQARIVTIVDKGGSDA